jgi:hypothetical protein
MIEFLAPPFKTGCINERSNLALGLTASPGAATQAQRREIKSENNLLLILRSALILFNL